MANKVAISEAPERATEIERLRFPFVSEWLSTSIDVAKEFPSITTSMFPRLSLEGTEGEVRHRHILAVTEFIRLLTEPRNGKRYKFEVVVTENIE